MKLKLDENLGVRGQSILRDNAHDVATVVEQNLQGSNDDQLATHCADEGRVLVTLDMDFANTLRFPPERTAGIAVLRLPTRPSLPLLLELVSTLAGALKTEPIHGRLWIVEPGRIRVHEAD